MADYYHICPEPSVCNIALEVAKLRGELTTEISSLAEIVKALRASSAAAFFRGEKIMASHDDRIGKVEKKIWWASGAASAITAVITFVITYLKTKE